ncbi:hypothetical protein HYS00_05030 [Candidatus Microgenomates bacterium]|nr:hypothetical protein [Candidatus Microgenomates bacterium]
MLDIVNEIWFTFSRSFVRALPNFFIGLIILLIGLIVANLVKRLLLTLFTFFRFEAFFQHAKLLEKGEIRLWEEILGEVIRWAIVLLFLVPALETWGFTRATAVIDQFVLYLPNIIIAVVIGFIGLVCANLLADIVRRSAKTFGSPSTHILSGLARATVLFFTILVVLNQLGVAQDLIRILFTGIVGMLALAGGLAFGLGGKDIAHDVLVELRKKIK